MHTFKFGTQMWNRLCLFQMWKFSILFRQSVFCMLTAWWVSYLQSASNCIGVQEMRWPIGLEACPHRFTFSWTAPALGTIIHQLNDHVQSYLFGKCSALLVLHRPAQIICNLHSMGVSKGADPWVEGGGDDPWGEKGRPRTRGGGGLPWV